MTPIAMKIANQLTLPLKQRTFENERVLSLFSQEMHCFDITAIAGPIGDVMDEGNVWPDVASMLPDLFLPSPITWLEMKTPNGRSAYVIEKDGDWFSLSIVVDSATPQAFEFATYRPCTVLESPDRVKVEMAEEPVLFFEDKKGDVANADVVLHEAEAVSILSGKGANPVYAKEQIGFARRRGALAHFQIKAKEYQIERAEAYAEAQRLGKAAIVLTTLALDLINTPGIVGMKQHAPHRGLARKLSAAGVGRYPLQAWSEVTVKTHTVFDDGEYQSGDTFRKCLHFVRAHRRHYRSGHETIVRAHWRGDPALGIKRTRYKVAA